MGSHARGYYGESRIAKRLGGKIVGRSKAVVVDGFTIEIDHTSPPDVVTPLFAVESKWRKDLPVSISNYVIQAETNAAKCKPKLIPVAVVRDANRGNNKVYYILNEKDFIDLLGGK